MTGLRLECVTIDALHALDLGLAGHIVANILWETVIQHKWGKPSIEQNVEILDANLRAWQKTKKTQRPLQGKLTKERLRSDSGYPKLKAKGAQTRYLAEYALYIAKLYDTGSVHDRRKVAVAQQLCRLYELMRISSQFFSPEAAEEFKEVGQSMVAIYSTLYVEAHSQGKRLWKFPPKAHMVDHMVTYQAKEWGNPSYCWCYSDEDLVGLSVEIAKACHPNTMAITAIVKWLLLAFDQED